MEENGRIFPRCKNHSRLETVEIKFQAFLTNSLKTFLEHVTVFFKVGLRDSRQQVIKLNTITGRVQCVNNYISSFRLI